MLCYKLSGILLQCYTMKTLCGVGWGRFCMQSFAPCVNRPLYKQQNKVKQTVCTSWTAAWPLVLACCHDSPGNWPVIAWQAAWHQHCSVQGNRPACPAAACKIPGNQILISAAFIIVPTFYSKRWSKNSEMTTSDGVHILVIATTTLESMAPWELDVNSWCLQFCTVRFCIVVCLDSMLWFFFFFFCSGCMKMTCCCVPWGATPWSHLQGQMSWPTWGRYTDQTTVHFVGECFL